MTVSSTSRKSSSQPQGNVQIFKSLRCPTFPLYSIPLSCKLQNILIKASSLYAEVPNKTSYAYFLPMQILLSLKILPIYHVNQSKRKCRWKNQMRMSSNLRIASFWGSIYYVPESMIENLTNYPFNHYKGASSRHYLRFINAGPETQKG